MSKCKAEGCEQEVDVFYYCDDHFEEGICYECGEPHSREDEEVKV